MLHQPADQNPPLRDHRSDLRFHDFSYIHDTSEQPAKLQVVWEAIMEKVVEIAAKISKPDTSANGRPPELSSDEPAAEPPAKRTRGQSDLISFLMEDSGQPDSDNQQERPPTEQQITAYYMQLPTAATDPENDRENGDRSILTSLWNGCRRWIHQSKN